MQARFDFRIEWRKLWPAPEYQFPRSCLLEEVTRAVGLFLFQPVHEFVRSARDARKPRQVVNRIDQLAVARRRRYRIALDANKITDAIEIRLRIGAQIVVKQYQHAVIDKPRAVVGQMRRVATHLDHLRNFYQKLVERIVRQRVVTPEFVGGVDSLDRVAERADDFASRNMNRDALGRLGKAEVRINLANRADAVGVAKVMRVPLDALVVVRGEEIGLLDSGGQIDAAL